MYIYSIDVSLQPTLKYRELLSNSGPYDSQKKFNNKVVRQFWKELFVNYSSTKKQYKYVSLLCLRNRTTCIKKFILQTREKAKAMKREVEKEVKVCATKELLLLKAIEELKVII